jgi:hypothetical protein
VVERGGFEPPKAFADRFTVCSLWPLGNLSGKQDMPDMDRPSVKTESEYYHYKDHRHLELAMGLEPATC